MKMQSVSVMSQSSHARSPAPKPWNPVPFPALVTVDGVSVMAFSPERYAARRGDRLESRPIKGTRPRGRDAGEDQKLLAELKHSDKDRAENIMIVDLVRNDIGRVSETGTVETLDLCRAETFASVHHLVSTVRGRLQPGTGVAQESQVVLGPGVALLRRGAKPPCSLGEALGYAFALVVHEAQAVLRPGIAELG